MNKLLDAIYRELNNIANDNKYDNFTQKDACGYYNTIFQWKHELDEITQECEKYDFYLQYEKGNNSDNDLYYTSGGTIHIYFTNWQHSPSYQFKILLHYIDRYWGYCMCEPTDEGYNPKYGCCGAGCDASFPAFDLIKTQAKHFEFQGQERDLWVLEAEWNGTNKEDYEEKIKRENLQRLEEEIHRLLDARDKLLNEGNNNA